MAFGSLNAQHTDNIQQLTPSVLLQEGRIEFKSCTNLYSQRSVFNDNANRVDTPVRSTFMASVQSVLYGKSNKINYGLELWIRSRRDGSRNSSPFSIFNFNSNSTSRTELAYIGPKIKIQPIESLGNFSIQSTLLFPFALDLDGSENENRIYVDDDRTLWINQFFYDHNWQESWNLFLEMGMWISLDREGNSEHNKFELPVKAFLSYFASNRWTIYYSQEFWPRLGEGVIEGYFVASGLGSKFQLIQNFLELEVLYTKFLIGKNMGAGSTYNLGLRMVMWSKQSE